MQIYLICPVRNCTPEQHDAIASYVAELEAAGHTVHYPPRDVDQDDPTGYRICCAHRTAMRWADRVDIIWDATSTGSHFDLGMAFALDKPVMVVMALQPDREGKSYLKVAQHLDALVSP
jgi:nucleoside 2-deoxyribosyltransferase